MPSSDDRPYFSCLHKDLTMTWFSSVARTTLLITKLESGILYFETSLFNISSWCFPSKLKVSHAYNFSGNKLWLIVLEKPVELGRMTRWWLSKLGYFSEWKRVLLLWGTIGINKDYPGKTGTGATKVVGRNNFIENVPLLVNLA